MASKGMQTSCERSPLDNFSLGSRCCALEPEIYSRAMGFPGCHCWRGNHTVKTGLPQRGLGRMAECASELIGKSGRGSHTSLQAENIMLQNPQTSVVWFAV